MVVFFSFKLSTSRSFTFHLAAAVLYYSCYGIASAAAAARTVFQIALVCQDESVLFLSAASLMLKPALYSPIASPPSAERIDLSLGVIFAPFFPPASGRCPQAFASPLPPGCPHCVIRFRGLWLDRSIIIPIMRLGDQALPRTRLAPPWIAPRLSADRRAGMPSLGMMET